MERDKQPRIIQCLTALSPSYSEGFPAKTVWPLADWAIIWATDRLHGDCCPYECNQPQNNALTRVCGARTMHTSQIGPEIIENICANRSTLNPVLCMQRACMYIYIGIFIRLYMYRLYICAQINYKAVYHNFYVNTFMNRSVSFSWFKFLAIVLTNLKSPLFVCLTPKTLTWNLLFLTLLPIMFWLSRFS